MASAKARCERVNPTGGESCRIHAFEFSRAIKLTLLLPLVCPVVYAQPAPPVQQLVFRPYHAVGNTDREKLYFLNMYLRDSRALDCLLTRPDWDGKTIVLIGGSQGGQQSFALAGLRPEKITAVLVCVPAGADTNGDLHGRKSGFPDWPADNPKAMETSLYFDPVNFAARIKAPVMAGMGFIDTVSPPAGIWTALNQIPGPTGPLPLIESEHDNYTPE